MDTLKVCILRLVACLYQCVEAGLHKSGHAAAENCLLAEKICFCFFLKCCLKDTASCSADACCISLSDLHGVSAGILLNGNKTRNSLSCYILGTNGMSRALRSDHNNVNSCRRDDLFEVDIKAVGKAESLSVCDVILNVVSVKSCLLFIVYEDHDDIGGLNSICCVHNGKAILLCLCCGLGALIQADHNITSGIS